jgi:hypothetical protein
LGKQEQEKDKNLQQAKARFQVALADLDEAIRLQNRWKKALLDQLKAQGVSEVRTSRRINGYLGLMHHHRYQVYEALGEKEKASADREFATRLGYDPAKHGL